MEINYLKEFVTLARNCQLHEAAEELHITPSVLSKHIKSMEKEMGAEFFVHYTGKTELSEMGKAFLPYAMQIASLQSEYMDVLTNSTGKGIFIGSDPTISLRQIDMFFSSYSVSHPNLHIDVAEYDKAELRTLLRNGTLDMVICCRDYGDTDSEFYSFPYYKDKIVAVLSAKHPLAHKEYLTSSDIASCVFVQRGSMNFAQYIDPTLPAAQYRANRVSFLVHMLNQGNSIALVPTNPAYHMITSDYAENLLMCEVCPTTFINVDVLCLKTKKNSPFIQEFASYIRNNNEIPD